MKREFQSSVFDEVRNKLVSAHCTVMSNVLTVTDKNHKQCIFPILPVDVPRSYITSYDLNSFILFQSQHGAKSKKGKMSEQLKYCNNLIKELFSKKHQVSLVWKICIYMLLLLNNLFHKKCNVYNVVDLCLAILQTCWCWCSWSSWLPWHHQEAYGLGNNQSK